MNSSRTDESYTEQPIGDNQNGKSGPTTEDFGSEGMMSGVTIPKQPAENESRCQLMISGGRNEELVHLDRSAEDDASIMDISAAEKLDVPENTRF